MVLAQQQVELYVNGDQQEGWSAKHTTDLSSPNSRLIQMNVKIKAIDGGYLVLMNSLDGTLYCDFWCATFDEAKEICLSDYGVDFKQL